MSNGPTVWSVIDSDNYECGGIVSLHWSREGAAAHALDIVHHEDKICREETGAPMKLTGHMEWSWQHRTVKVVPAKVKA